MREDCIGSPRTTGGSECSLNILGPRTSRHVKLQSRMLAAASSVSFKFVVRCSKVEKSKTGHRKAGTVSFRSSNCFPLSSGARVANPVMFPPGRARLATNPFPTGSVSCAITMGIVTVASLAAGCFGTSCDDDLHLEMH